MVRWQVLHVNQLTVIGSTGEWTSRASVSRSLSNALVLAVMLGACFEIGTTVTVSFFLDDVSSTVPCISKCSISLGLDKIFAFLLANLIYQTF